MTSAIATVLVVFIIIGGFVYGCTEADRQYYAAQKVCVESGGSWLPYGNAAQAGYTAQCLKLIPREPGK